MNEYFVLVTHDYIFAVKAETPQAAEAIVEKAWGGGDIYVIAPENDGFVPSEYTDYTSDFELLEHSQTFRINSVDISTELLDRGQFDDRCVAEDMTIQTHEYLLEFNHASLGREDLQRALGAFRNALPSDERSDEEFIVEGIAFTGGFWTAFAYLQTRLEWNEVADLQIGEAGNTLSWRSISAKEMREIHYPNRLLHPSQVSRGRPAKPETPRPTRPSRGLLDLNTEGR